MPGRLDLPATLTGLFVLASAVAIIARRIRLPYTVGLVVAGLAIGSLHRLSAISLTPEFLFALALPGLVFEAAFNLRLRDLWDNRLTLTFLALPGVALAVGLTTVLLPGAMHMVGVAATVSATGAFLFAALISATDPIAVLALFKSLGAPHRLTVVIEAESLLNDATAIAFFVAAVAIAAPTMGTATGPLVWHFVAALVGGATIGIVVGGSTALVIARVDDPMVEITLTIIAAYASFGLAQQFGLSGVLATVAAGLLAGHYARRKGMSPSTRVAVDVFWEYLAFALNSVVFMLIGFEVQLARLVEVWRPILAAFVVVLVARVVTTGAVMVLVRGSRERMPWRWFPVLTWGGLRGALSMVLAVSLPESTPDRAMLIALTFGVVALSILGQGLSMPPLLRRLGLVVGIHQAANESPAAAELTDG